MASWDRIKAGIFAGESGGDYDALFKYSNRPGGRFSNIKLTDMTVNQAIDFARPSGEYAQWVKANNKGTLASPMGGFQIVGDTLKDAKNWAGLTGNERMTVDIQDRLGKAILKNQGTGAWSGYRGPRAPGSVSKVPIPSAEEYGMHSGPDMAGGEGVRLASLNPDLYKVDPAEKPQSALSKASGTFAQAGQAMQRGGGSMLPPAPILVADAGTKFPDWYTHNFNPAANTETPSADPIPVPDLVPPFGEPNAPYGVPLQPIVPAAPTQEWREGRPTIGPDPDVHSRGYNIIAGGIKDIATTRFDPGADIGNWLSDTLLKNWGITETEADKQEGNSPLVDTSKEFRVADDLLFGGVGEVGGNKTSSASTGGPGSSTTIPAGTTFLPKEPPVFAPELYPYPPEPGEVPDRPLAQDIDFQPWLDRMEKFRPEELNRQEYMKERVLSNLSRALAAGASGSGWSGWGGALARAGSGFGLAQAETTDQWLADDQARDEAQRQWGLGQIDLEMKLAQRSQDLKNQNAQTTYSNELDEYNQGTQYDMEKYKVDTANIDKVNQATEKQATDFYNWQNTIGQLTETKVSDVTDKHIVLQHTDAEGKRTFEMIKLDDPYSGLLPKEYLDSIKSMESVYGNSPDVYKMKYVPLMAQKSKLGVQAVMAEELLTLEALPHIIPDYEEVEKQAQEILGKRGLYAGGSGYDKAYQSIMTALVTPRININDKRFLEAAAGFNSVGALLLLGAAQRNAEGQPATLPPGPPVRQPGQ